MAWDFFEGLAIAMRDRGAAQVGSVERSMTTSSSLTTAL